MTYFEGEEGVKPEDENTAAAEAGSEEAGEEAVDGEEKTEEEKEEGAAE